MPLPGRQRLSYGELAGHNPVSCRKPAPGGRDLGLRTSARRLLPVIAFAVVLSLALAGVLRGSVSGLTLGRARPAGVGAVRDIRGGVTGVSAKVGAIPGVLPGSAYPWEYSAGQSPTTSAIAAKALPSAAAGSIPRLGRLLQADLLVVAPTALPAGLAATLHRLRGVVAAVPVAAGRIQVNGVFVDVLGVDPAAFRPFAAKPTARSA